MKDGTNITRRALLFGGALAVLILLLANILGGPSPGAARPELPPDEIPEQTQALPGQPGEEPDRQPPGGADADDAWGVTVHDHDGTPLKGVRVSRNDSQGPSVLTDEKGFAPVFMKQGETSVIVVIDSDMICETFVLDRPHGEVRLPHYIPLLLRIVDGVTGRHLRGGSLAHINRRGARRVLAEGPEGFVVDRAPAKPGIPCGMTFAVVPPDGYGHATDRVRFKTTVSIFSKRLRGEIPVWPELDLRVTVVEEDGTPISGARVAGVRMLNDRLKTESQPSSATGEVVVLGVPALRSEWISVTVSDGGDRQVTKGARITGFSEPLQIRAVLPRPNPDGDDDTDLPFEGRIGIGGSVGASSGRYGSRRNLLVAAGSIEVQVRRRNGDPAALAAVRIRHGKWWKNLRTDESGVVRISDLDPRDYIFEVLEPGFIPGTPRTITAVSGETVRMQIVEDSGRTATLLVTDGRGRPIPSARVLVTSTGGRSLLPIDESGEQWITPLTDPSGRVILTGLPSFPVKVTVSQGSRKAQGTLAPGELLELELRAH